MLPMAPHRARGGDSAMAIDVKLLDDLDAVAVDAAGALDRARTPRLYDRLDWFRLTLRHCPPPGRLCVARAREDDRAAWLFLMVDRGVGRLLGSWYTLEGGLAGDARPALAKAIAAALPRLRRVEIGPVAVDEAHMLADAFAAAGWSPRLAETNARWSIATEGRDWPAYWAARPGALRSTVARRSRTAGLAIEIHRAFHAAAWAAYEAVYAQSWKPAEGAPAFLRALAEQEGAAATLRLGTASLDGRPVAAQFWLVEAGRATIHKLAHVEDARGVSPGTLLSAAMFRHVIERDQPRIIDFGTGDDVYKADWMDRREPLFTLTARNRRHWRGRLESALHAGRALVRARVGG